jgi:hypothetical protein
MGTVYKHVNDKHLTHLSQIKDIQWLTRGIPPPSPIMTRGSNHGRRLQSATFRGCVGWSGSTCNSPVCSLGSTARPRSSQKKTATASVWAYNPLGDSRLSKPKHLVTVSLSPANHKTNSLPGHRLFTCRKITPESRTFQNIIYEPHVWVEEVVFPLRF